MGALLDMVGRRFGYLLVVCREGTLYRGEAAWRCACDCGEETVVCGYSLRKQATISCGCHRRKHLAALRETHGEASPETRTKEYRAWSNMKTRCYNPRSDDYPEYGGRGIHVCARWLESYEWFLGDMGRAPSRLHSIDRRNNNRGYEPGNCRWATKKEQANNRRPTSTLRIRRTVRSNAP